MALNQKDVDQLISSTQIELTGASTNGVKNAIYEVLKEFFTDSGAWIEDLPINSIANQDTYAVAAANDGRLLRLIGLWDNTGIPVPAFMPNFGLLKLVHVPTTNGDPTKPWTARFEKTVVPSAGTDVIPLAPDWTLTIFGEHIKDGVLGKLMNQPGKSYTNDSKAAYHLKRFRAGIALARTQMKRMNVVGAQAWSYPRFVKGSQRGGVSTAWPTRAF